MELNSQQEHRREVEQTYLEYEDYLSATRLDFQRQLTTAILTLSSAALALSVAMLRVFGSDQKLDEPWILMIAWIAYGIAVIGTLSAYVCSILALDKQSDFAKEYYLNENDEFYRKDNPWTIPRVRFLYGSVLSFVVGVIATICFAALNI